MSDEDDFGLTLEDEAELAAATANALTGKRNLVIESEDAANPSKRTRVDGEHSTVLANKVLKNRFGLNGFRLEQEAAITRLLDGGSAVVVFPTGGGKSLCYQVSILTSICLLI